MEERGESQGCKLLTVLLPFGSVFSCLMIVVFFSLFPDRQFYWAIPLAFLGFALMGLFLSMLFNSDEEGEGGD